MLIRGNRMLHRTFARRDAAPGILIVAAIFSQDFCEILIAHGELPEAFCAGSYWQR